MDLLLRTARPDELDRVVDFYNYIIDAQEGQEFSPGWTKDVYPDREHIKETIDAGQMYLGLVGDELVCAEVITGNDEIYEQVRFAADLSRAAGRKVIRLDVTKGNDRARDLYLSEGFEYIGEYPVYYEDTGLADFWMLEMAL